MRKIYVFGLALVAMLVIGIAFVTAQLYFRQQALPLYVANQQASTSSQPVRTLQKDDVRYVHGATELALEPVGSGWSQQIGRTTDGMGIYAIAGRPQRDFVLVTDLMSPATVYRNASVAPIVAQDLEVTGVELVAQQSIEPKIKGTTEPKVIQAVLDTLKQGTAQAPQVEHQKYRIRLLADQLQGLGYGLNMNVNIKQDVYLAELTNPDAWLPVGDAFKQWVMSRAR